MAEKLFESPFTNRLSVVFRCSGVYGIRHGATGRMYVGSSKDTRARLYQHLSALLSDKHHSRYLQNAWRKYGRTAFFAVLLERDVPAWKLIEREQAWIDLFAAYEKGFNARPKAESMRGVRWSNSRMKRDAKATCKRGVINHFGKNSVPGSKGSGGLYGLPILTKELQGR